MHIEKEVNCRMNEPERIVSMQIESLSQGWLHWTVVFGDDTHEFLTAATVSAMLGRFIDSLYSLYLEFDVALDNCLRTSEYAEAVCDDPADPHRVTGMKTSFTWDNEGDTIEWKLFRRLSHPENGCADAVSVDLSYTCGEKSFHYEVTFLDLCYALTKAATVLLKELGLSGYRKMSDGDRLDLTAFLRLKRLALSGRIEPLSCTDGKWTSPLDEELALFIADM